MTNHWRVYDRNGREIYMTEGRWLHILSKHHELIGHLDDLLDTLRRGDGDKIVEIPNGIVINVNT